MAKPRCKYLVVPPTDSGRVIVRKDWCYRCACPIPEPPVLPASITSAYGFHPISEKSKTMISTDQCARCPLFELTP